jgi:hypothetical protein
MNPTLKKMMFHNMGSVISRVDTREKLMEVIEPLLENYYSIDEIKKALDKYGPRRHRRVDE